MLISMFESKLLPCIENWKVCIVGPGIIIVPIVVTVIVIQKKI